MITTLWPVTTICTIKKNSVMLYIQFPPEVITQTAQRFFFLANQGDEEQRHSEKGKMIAETLML